MWGFVRFGPGTPPFYCHACGQRMAGAERSAEEIPQPDGDIRIVNLTITHRPCGCVWAAGRFIARQFVKGRA